LSNGICGATGALEVEMGDVTETGKVAAGVPPAVEGWHLAARIRAQIFHCHVHS